MSPSYVATLFGQAAETFDERLIHQLGYRVPALVRGRIEALALGPWERYLDIGCGTGLMGATISDLARHMTGIDLARKLREVRPSLKIICMTGYGGTAVSAKDVDQFGTLIQKPFDRATLATKVREVLDT